MRSAGCFFGRHAPRRRRQRRHMRLSRLFALPIAVCGPTSCDHVQLGALGLPTTMHTREVAVTQGQSASTLRTVSGLTTEEWCVARTARVNVLLVGFLDLTERTVDALRPDFCGPIAVWHPVHRLVLPPIGNTGTLILHDVGSMPRNDQHKLCDWLGANAGRTRVVSTARLPLFPLVHAGEFAETLYYRLNILLFEVVECDSRR